MSQTIAVPERLAARLAKKAKSQRTTVESLVVTILDAAIDADDSSDDWSAKNARRVALIHQRFTQGLDAAEVRELDQLQELATQRLEAWDSQLLSDVAAMQKAVDRVIPHSGTASGSGLHSLLVFAKE